ncbi:MAG: hypothetical protein KGI41_03465 [Patescibacteria group bacterium]|nr:hypothetical protein [Patescibacteria group bacterium]MDE1966269.1 hypothetical protein [Patescibacteria group bacterium]
MRKRNIVAACLILLVAAGIAGSLFFASRLSPRSAPEAAQPAPGPLTADAYPLYPSALWGAAEAASFSAGASSFSGYEAAAEPKKDVTDLAALFAPFERYYQQKLEAAGWTEDINLAANGPGSGITAYRKGGAVLIVGYESVFKAGGKNAPAECPCDLTLYVFSGK